jgi:hypothetical protein
VVQRDPMAGSSSSAMVVMTSANMKFNEEDLDRESGRRRCSNRGFDELLDTKPSHDIDSDDIMSEMSTTAGDSCRPSLSFSERHSSCRTTGRYSEIEADRPTWKRLPPRSLRNSRFTGRTTEPEDRSSASIREEEPVVAGVASLLKYKQSDRGDNSSDDEADAMFFEFLPSLPLSRKNLQQLSQETPLRRRALTSLRKIGSLRPESTETQQPELDCYSERSTTADSLEDLMCKSMTCTQDSLPRAPIPPTTDRY